MRMLQRGARGRAVVLENHDVAEAKIVLQIQHPIAPGPEDALDLLLAHRRQRGQVIGRFDDHLVRAHPVHPVEEPFTFAVEIAFYSQRGKFVRHDPQVPALRIGLRAVAVGENFRRRFVLVSLAKRAEIVPLVGGNCLDLKVARALLPLGRNDHPAAGDGVFAQIGHRNKRSRLQASGFRLPASGFPRDRGDHAVNSNADFKISTFSLPDSSRVTATTSKRHAMSDSRFMNKYDVAMRLSRCRFCHVTDSNAWPNLPLERARTSTNTSTPASRATMSSSPQRVRKRRSRMV